MTPGLRSALTPERLPREGVIELLGVDLVKELGFEIYSESERQPLVRQARAVIENRLERRLAALLSHDDRYRIGQLLERLEHEQVFVLLWNRIPSLRLITDEVVTEFRQDLETWKAWVTKSRARDGIESPDR